MTITVEATYENGMLKLKEPLPFKEHEQVQVTVQPSQKLASECADLISRSHGVI